MTYEALVLAFAAAFFPFGLVVFTLLIASEPFKARAVAFLLGAIAMTFWSGIAFITLARDLDLAGIAGVHQASGELDIGIGLLLLLVFFVMRQRAARPGRPPRRPPAWIHGLMRSPLLAFALGAALYAPSPLYLGALKDVADAGLSAAANVFWVAVMTVIITSLIEVPVLLMLRDPAAARARVASLNAWMGRNGRAVAMWAVLVIGAYLVVRGALRVSGR